MIGISKLYFGTVEESDRLRYRRGVHRRPVVVWNVTPACNLACSHCYAATAGAQRTLTTEQALAVIDDLAAFQVPVILFSGGMDTKRRDIEPVVGQGLTLSTVGVLITTAVTGLLIYYLSMWTDLDIGLSLCHEPHDQTLHPCPQKYINKRI